MFWKSVKTLINLWFSDATLYVPESATDTFKETRPWRYFSNIKGHVFQTGIYDVTAGSDETMPCEYFSLSGIRMGNVKEHLAPGTYIMRQGNTTRKITVK